MPSSVETAAPAGPAGTGPVPWIALYHSVGE